MYGKVVDNDTRWYVIERSADKRTWFRGPVAPTPVRDSAVEKCKSIAAANLDVCWRVRAYKPGIVEANFNG